MVCTHSRLPHRQSQGEGGVRSGQDREGRTRTKWSSHTGTRSTGSDMDEVKGSDVDEIKGVRRGQGLGDQTRIWPRGSDVDEAKGVRRGRGQGGQTLTRSRGSDVGEVKVVRRGQGRGGQKWDSNRPYRLRSARNHGHQSERRFAGRT